MDLISLLRTSERRANLGYLSASWVLTLLAYASLIPVFGFAALWRSLAISVALLVIPTVFHLLRRGERWIKYILCLTTVANMVANAATNPGSVIVWPLWFYCLVPGAYYMTPSTVVVSSLATLAGLFGTVTWIMPPVPTEVLVQELTTGVLIILMMSVLIFLAARRFSGILRSLDEAARVDRERSDALAAAWSKLNQSAAAVQESAGNLDQQAGRVQALVKESVGPAVASLRTGFNDQDQALTAAVETMEQVAVSARQLSDAATDQADAVAKSMSALEKVSRIVDQLGSLASDVRHDAELASQLVENGRTAMSHNQSAGQEVEATVRLTSERLAQLGSRSQQIGQVVTLIQGIADQTSLLSLNAAIEAARAGEQGRGFAVVAEEVRKLADRSSQASQEIAKLIDEVESGIEQSLQAMDRTTASVASSAAQNEQMAEVLAAILEATGRTTQRIEEIHLRASNLTESVQQLTQQMSHLAALAAENSATAEEMLASNTHMLDMAQQVRAVGQRAVELVAQVEAAVMGVNAVVAELGATSTQLGALAGTLGAAARE